MQLLADRAQMPGADTARQHLLASCKSVTEQTRNNHTAGLSELQGLQLPKRTTQLHLVFLMGFSLFTPWLHPANLCQSSGEPQGVRVHWAKPVEFEEVMVKLLSPKPAAEGSCG